MNYGGHPMPKTRNQRTKVKKQTKRSTKNTNEEQIPDVAFLGSPEEEEFAVMPEDYADVSDERASILAIVKDLEGQVDTAYQLKEILEAELEATQQKLSEQTTANTQLESQVESLKAQAVLVEQLREDISFAEEERDKSAGSLADIQPQFEAVTEERDALAEELESANALTKEFEGEKLALEAQVMNLKDKIADMGDLRGELDETIETRRHLDEEIQDFTSRLDVAEKSNKAFEEDLTSAQKQVENLQEKLMVANSRMAEVRAQLEEQQVTNRNIMEANTRLENEIKTSKFRHDTIKKELEAFKKAMHDIHSEASRSSGRVRQRYFKLKDKK
jgi:chromosome segregation ATPase